MLQIVKRVLIGAVVAFTVAVFALFAWNFYRNWAAEPAPPGIIFERQNRPGYS